LICFLFGFIEDLNEELPTPSEMTVELFKHQRQGLAWMVKRENSVPSGGIIADHMGLGKTMYFLHSHSLLFSKIESLVFSFDD
jgi:SNF2 family DNA or RNA helicase